VHAASTTCITGAVIPFLLRRRPLSGLFFASAFLFLIAHLSFCNTRQLLLKDVAEGKWRAWVQNERGNATEAELAMARGPRLTCTMWNAMDYQAVTFLTQGGHLLANECLVLTWHTVHEPSGQRVKYPYVGKVKSFLTNVPPWALGNYEER